MISEVEVLDETQGQRYRELAAASIARHSGLGWPEGGEDVWRERASEPHHRLVP